MFPMRIAALALVLMTATPALAEDAVPAADIQIAPVIVVEAARFTHALVTDVAEDVIEIFSI
jgi:hypothetical protein